MSSVAPARRVGPERRCCARWCGRRGAVRAEIGIIGGHAEIGIIGGAATRSVARDRASEGCCGARLACRRATPSHRAAPRRARRPSHHVRRTTRVAAPAAHEGPRRGGRATPAAAHCRRHVRASGPSSRHRSRPWDHRRPARPGDGSMRAPTRSDRHRRRVARTTCRGASPSPARSTPALVADSGRDRRSIAPSSSGGIGNRRHLDPTRCSIVSSSTRWWPLIDRPSRRHPTVTPCDNATRARGSAVAVTAVTTPSSTSTRHGRMHPASAQTICTWSRRPTSASTSTPLTIDPNASIQPRPKGTPAPPSGSTPTPASRSAMPGCSPAMALWFPSDVTCPGTGARDSTAVRSRWFVLVVAGPRATRRRLHRRRRHRAHA